MSSLIVSRFGGDEAANSEEVRKSASVITSDPARRYVIVSAPGSLPDSVGITDMLYLCHSRFCNCESYDEILAKIAGRYSDIVSGLGLKLDVNAEIDALRKSIDSGKSLDFIGSRGEYITAKIFAEYLGWDFVDASELIFFNKDGTVDADRTFIAAREKLASHEHAVIPSFYGRMSDGSIKTFRRGDCDTAGALIACAVQADLFEKWSESAKIYSADPSVIPNPEVVRNITYMEALEFNYVGMNIATDNVVLMLDHKGIPMKIASTHDPQDNGMLISPKLPEDSGRGTTACIAGHKIFTTIHIRKYGLNKDYKFDEKLFGLFAKHRIACQHYLTGIHQMSVILKAPVFDIRRGEILNEIKEVLNPSSVTIEKGLSLIAVIGEGMGTVKGVFSVIFDALALASIKVKMAEQGADSQNIIIGVSDSDYDGAIKALYDALILN